MKEQLENIYNSAKSDIDNAQSINDIENIRLKYLSRKGEFNSIKKGLKDLSDEEKRTVGALANQITKDLEDMLKAKHDVFYQKELRAKLEQERIDITLSSKFTPLGKIHPLTSTTNEIVSIFQNLGFSVVPTELSPEVETEYYNFDMLNVPKEHPARDVQDTFYVKDMPGVVLRSQTSGAQIHVMENQKPPIKVVSPGRVYRNENINARKNNFFHQIEGLRSSFFPFTEPSAEVDVQCIMCQGKGCRICGGTGWLEILGCGMVDINVLKGVGIDPEVYSGFAFGMGIERLAMLKYAIDDIRLFFNNDKRFLEQF